MEASALVDRLGPHATTRLGLDLHAPAGRDAWLLACLLLSARVPEEKSLAALQPLLTMGLLTPSEVTLRGPALAARLAQGPWKEPERLAASLFRVARALVERGGVDGVDAAADGLDALGEGLVGLAPGLGPATVLRFLRPLRGLWANAADTPAAPAALAAAVCLGWASEDAETLALPDPAGPAAADLEAALERLGATACRRGRSAQCPLADACAGREA